jgi:farnesol dehydrogenase
MRVLVTGVSGYLGGRVARRLEQGGHTVRGFVRDPSRWRERPPKAEAAKGDVTDLAALRAAAQGCQAVVHAAAHVKVWDRRKSRFAEVNVGGLRHAADAAAAVGAPLFYVSSFMALGPTDGRVFDEETPRAAGDAHNQYEKSKWAADVLARRLAGEGQRIVRLYPGVIFGPGTLTAGNHVTATLRQHAQGKLPGLLGPGDRRQCFAYVEDVADGIAAAIDRARPGSAYILGGENRTVAELFRVFEAASGIPAPRRHIPYGLAGLVGRVQRLWAEVGGREPTLTDEVVEIYRHEWAYSSARAERELGYKITPFAEGVVRTVAWLRATGALPLGRA